MSRSSAPASVRRIRSWTAGRRSPREGRSGSTTREVLRRRRPKRTQIPKHHLARVGIHSTAAPRTFSAFSHFAAASSPTRPAGEPAAAAAGTWLCSPSESESASGHRGGAPREVGARVWILAVRSAAIANNSSVHALDLPAEHRGLKRPAHTESITPEKRARRAPSSGGSSRASHPFAQPRSARSTRRAMRSNPSSRLHSRVVGVPRLLRLQADQVLERVRHWHLDPLQQELSAE